MNAWDGSAESANRKGRQQKNPLSLHSWRLWFHCNPSSAKLANRRICRAAQGATRMMPDEYTPLGPEDRLPPYPCWSFHLHCRLLNAPAGFFHLLVPSTGPQAGKVLAFDEEAERYSDRIRLRPADIAAAKWNAPYLHRCARRGIGWPFPTRDWPFVVVPDHPCGTSAVPHPKQATLQPAEPAQPA